MKWDQLLSKIGLALTTLLICILSATLIHAQSASPVKVLRTGEEISLNGDQLPIRWRQWEVDGQTYLGISDVSAQQRLGLELLSSNDPKVQPVSWFNEKGRVYNLAAQHLGKKRYVDLTPILREITQELAVVGDLLEILTTPVQVQEIRVGKQSWGERIVIDLNRPLLWQIKQGRDQATLTLPAFTPSSISKTFPLQSEGTDPPLLVVKSSQSKQTELEISLPESLHLQVSTLGNPTRLVIDLRPDALQPRQIRWQQGIDWRQDYLSVADAQFAVTWLELDPALVNLKPIWSNTQQMEGIARLKDMAGENQVEIAINGGFFNRDTKLPLGALKREGQWYSSPILNRGAIAWDNQGSFTMDRLRYQETLYTDTGRTFFLQALNSGYVQAGIARYTPAWGVTYTPLTDEETVVVVENQRVQRLEATTPHQKSPIPIPSNGYLLTIRGRVEFIPAFPIGTTLQLQNQAFPASFTPYPNILGAGPLLIKNGRVVLNAAGENFSEAFIQQKAHRSAIALTQAGKLLLVAMGDGVGRKGPTLEEATAILEQLGAIEALNLDGGSSTSLYLGGEIINRPPATTARIHNGIGFETQKFR